jgi:glycosyltransferase involved in cell wall biosynthesis
MRRRLLLATDSLDPSGVGEHMLALAQGLRADFDIVLAAPGEARGDLLGRAARSGLRVEALGDGDPGRLAEQRFDIAHIHAGIGWEGHRLAEAACLTGVGVVLRTEHLPYLLTDPDQVEAHRRGLDNLSGLICVSHAAAASFAEAGVPRAMIHVARNGVSATAPRRSRATTRRELGLAADAPVAITVARLTAQKNHAALLAALPDILAVHPTFRLVLVGTGPLDAELRDYAARFGEAVLFLGQRNDIADLLAAADLFVLPSLFEGLPLSLIEAMAAGLPTVATAIGGVDEAVDPGVTGLLATPERLAEAVLGLLGDPAASAAMGRAARRRFETHFSSERMCRETRDIYARLARPAAALVRKLACIA